MSCKLCTRVVLALSVVVGIAAAGNAAIVTLIGIDGFGASSFNSAGLWDSGAAPSAGNDYVVPDGTRLRTPPDGNSYTFAGDSLTINNATPYGDGFMYKGTGNTGTLTIDDLILDGGLISHANGTGDICKLDGNLTLASDSRIQARQGPIYIYSDIHGSAQLHNEDTSGDINCKLWIGSSNNTFTGNILTNGRLGLLDDANLNFVIGVNGVNNSVSDGGTQKHVSFDGDFVFDLSGASSAIGDAWTIIATTPASTYYGSTFTVADFTPLGEDAWIQPIGSTGLNYLFTESTGVLTVVPEPASAMMIILGLGGLALVTRRR